MDRRRGRGDRGEALLTPARHEHARHEHAGHTAAVRVGTAGWSIPRAWAERFPSAGSHLERYAGVLGAVEINSSFHQPHRPSSYARWAAAVPADFAFAVKVPREITHARRLVETREPLARLLGEVAPLGRKLGPLLVQLPPSLEFDARVAAEFFGMLRDSFAGTVACEPRHASWFGAAADALLVAARVARVAADPARVPAAAAPGGHRGLEYFRLHGSPRTYYSAYTDEYLDALAVTLSKSVERAEVWCVFDNTTLGAATGDALGLLGRLRAG